MVSGVGIVSVGVIGLDSGVGTTSGFVVLVVPVLFSDGVWVVSFDVFAGVSLLPEPDVFVSPCVVFPKDGLHP